MKLYEAISKIYWCDSFASRKVTGVDLKKSVIILVNMYVCGPSLCLSSCLCGNLRQSVNNAIVFVFRRRKRVALLTECPNARTLPGEATPAHRLIGVVFGLPAADFRRELRQLAAHNELPA